MTKLFLGIGNDDVKNHYDYLKKSKYVLVSYFYAKDGLYDFQKMFDEVIVDSGAFSFMTTQKNITKDQMDIYCDEYIKYINKFDIKNYVELDIDSIISYEYALELRHRLEKGTGKKCIPIWHSSRGKEEFIKMCQEYDYAGIGGLASKEELSKYKHLYPLLNKLAKRYDCKIHAMGFTPGKNLHEYGFYSTDSTTWRSGGKFGTLYKFENNCLKTLKKPEGVRLKDYKKADIWNMEQWIKYQKYIDRFIPT